MRKLCLYFYPIFLFFALFLLSLSQLFAQKILSRAESEIRLQLSELGLTDADLENWILTDQYQSQHNGIHHMYWQQSFQGIPVEGAILNISMDDNGRVWSLNHRFIPDLKSKLMGSRQLDASLALSEALNRLGLTSTSDLSVLNLPTAPDFLSYFEAPDIALEQIAVQLNYLKVEEVVNLAWKVIIYTQDAQHLWEIQIHAESGEVLATKDAVISCHFDIKNSADHARLHFGATKLMHAKPFSLDKITAPDSYRVYPLGIESPSHGGRSLEVDPADAIASPFGWHDTDGNPGPEFTITRGNNVHAQDDTNGNNGTGFSPDGGATLDFDYAIDFNQPIDQNSPVPNQSAAITNLFYWNNLIHDVFYRYGFDEASGNFQQNNYGNGGAAGDYVLADAQDGGGTNNANFSTPPDGGNGRMQMFLWTGTAGQNTFEVNSPAGIAGTYDMRPGGFGNDNFDITADLVVADDGSVNPSEACNALINGGTLNGKIALIDRGSCEFGAKCLNAQNAGAVGVIVVNNDATNPNGLVTMAPGLSGGSVNIPVAMVSLNSGNTIKGEINGGATVNIRMQATPSLDIDGDFDNGIIVHEYGHGISIRLTGGPGTSGCLNNVEQAGEGWSDWFGIVMTHLPSHTRNTARGIGTYALGEPITGVGIRTFPYSTDMSVNPHTYDAIKNLGLSAPHGIGSVFAVMLYDLYWNLIDQYGYDPDLYNGTGGNNIAIQLVMDGLKLQPCSPGFVDMRDAILAADQANNGGANEELIWRTFARRGLGFSASQGSSFSRTDGTEAFDLPPSIFPVEMLSFTASSTQDAIVLNWETALEKNNRGFELQRYNEQLEDFEQIIWIDGLGDTESGHQYQALDRDTLAGKSYTYRLKQMDFDGKFTFSDQVEARLDPNSKPQIRLFPNPLEEAKLNLNILGWELRSDVEIELYDKLGKLVWQESISKEEVKGSIELSLDDIPTGIYSLKVKTLGFSSVEKLLIRN
ncbi:MAG: T9SS-dependent M36 family metallopeptidase [Bacteroidota bacterium]